MGFAPELLAVASEYIKAQEHELKLPEDFEDALRDLLRIHNLLPIEQFDDPASVENAMIQSVESTFRARHKLGGCFSWKNRGAWFDKLEAATRSWINNTRYDDVVALAPKSADITGSNPHQFIDVATTADQQQVNMSQVKNALLAHLMSERSQTGTRKASSISQRKVEPPATHRSTNAATTNPSASSIHSSVAALA